MESDLRVIKTRRGIQSALISLLSEKQLSRVTVSEVCVRAQINRKTFYRHYRTIGDVISELEAEILDEFSDALQKGKSILDVGAVICDISALIGQRRGYFMRLMKHNPDLFTKGKIKAIMCRMVSVSLKNVGALEDEATVQAAAEFSVSGVLALYASWFDGGCTEDLEFLTDVAVKMITNGLTSFVSEEKLSEMRLK